MPVTTVPSGSSMAAAGAPPVRSRHGVSLLFHGTVADSQTGLIQQQLKFEQLVFDILAGLLVTVAP